MIEIGADSDGHIDIAELETQLVRHARRPLRIGSFSAASNVTGILTDTDAIAALLHTHGALSFWDYAAAGPYVPIRMAQSTPGAGDGKDAVFLSPHKFIGGPQTPGVLVVRRDLIRNRVPTVPGGGTVAFVGPHEHRYLDDPVAREEGGTPAIVESIRAGLVVALKQAVGTDAIAAREERLWRRALHRWTGNPHIEVLGNPQAFHCLTPRRLVDCSATAWSAATASMMLGAAGYTASARDHYWPSARSAGWPWNAASSTTAQPSPYSRPMTRSTSPG